MTITSLDNLYQQTITHQLAGVMFHNDGALFMRFLGLVDAGRLQAKRCQEETAGLQGTVYHYLDRYGYILQPETSKRQTVISNDAYHTAADDVSTDYKRKALAAYNKAWLAWEKETEQLYTAAVKWCLDNGHPDYMYFAGLLEDVKHERQTAQLLANDMQLTGYDLPACNALASIRTI